jgi:hypothetical protein
MSEEKRKEVKVEPESQDTPTPPQQLTPKQIFDAYPNDRDKAMNYLLLGIQSDLNRSANALEYFASKDVTSEKAKVIQKP